MLGVRVESHIQLLLDKQMMSILSYIVSVLSANLIAVNDESWKIHSVRAHFYTCIRSFLNFVSRTKTGFYRQAKLSELNF